VNKTTDKPQAVIEGEVRGTLQLQSRLDSLQTELMADPRFLQFLDLRDQVNQRWAEVRANIERVMVPAYQDGRVPKTLKGEWGSVTVTEKDEFNLDETKLPASFYKKVPDTSKIRIIYQLEGKAPKGTTPVKKYGIMVKFKQRKEPAHE
jgi:hypothetical protein